MTYLLNAKERKLLDELQIDHQAFRIRGQLPMGIGNLTIQQLARLGLLESGPGRFGETGWRLSDDGWRCMYGNTNDEIMAAGLPRHPLRVWSWPPTPDSAGNLPQPRGRLSTLKPQIAELQPRLKTLK